MVMAFIMVSCLLNGVSAANIQGMKFKFARKCISVGVCASISFSAPIPSQAMDAFDGAMSSMLMKKEKSVVERNFDALPEAVKKRKALAMCKDSSALSASGYNSASQCSNAVLQGSYESIMEGAAKGGPTELPSLRAAEKSSAPAAPTSLGLIPAASSPSPTASAPKPLSTPTPSPAQVQVASAEVEVASSEPMKKKIDLSGTPPAAKKRRALAACKKADTRKFARAGSEAKCTESTMKGDYDNIIEALEYGR